jgi:hypothetical protein
VAFRRLPTTRTVLACGPLSPRSIAKLTSAPEEWLEVDFPFPYFPVSSWLGLDKK